MVKDRHKPPSRIRYEQNNPTISFRVSRKVHDKLRELVRAEQIDVVVVYSLDRLTRDPGHGVMLTQEIEKHRVALETVTTMGAQRIS